MLLFNKLLHPPRIDRLDQHPSATNAVYGFLLYEQRLSHWVKILEVSLTRLNNSFSSFS